MADIRRPPSRSYILYEPDLASQKSSANAGALDKKRRGADKNKLPIRRPYNGMTIKEDTYAVISVVGLDNKPIPLGVSEKAADGSETNSPTDAYSDFILQTIQTQRAEKQQIVETFGDFYVFFFGQQPMSITVNGMLVNSEDFNWRTEFWHNYDKYFRGSKLVQMNARVYLAYDTVVIEGYPYSASASEDNMFSAQIPFTMSMIVTNYFDYSQIQVVNTDLMSRDSPYDAEVVELNPSVQSQVSTVNGSVNALVSSSTGLVGTENIPLPGPSEPAPSNMNLESIQSHQNWVNSKQKENVQWQLSTAMEVARDRTVSMMQTVSSQVMAGAMNNLFVQAGGVVNDLSEQAMVTTSAFGLFVSNTLPDAVMDAVDSLNPVTQTRTLLGIGASGLLDVSRGHAYMTSRFGKTVGDTISAIRDMSSAAEKVGGHLGETAVSTFHETVSRIQDKLAEGESVAMALGQAYTNFPYNLAESVQTEFEQVYDDYDYSTIVDANNSMRQVLEEAYGDIESSVEVVQKTFNEALDPYALPSNQQTIVPFGSDLAPESLLATYRSGVNARFKRSPQEILEELRRAQSTVRLINAETVIGIRAVDDDEIEPII